MTADPQVERRRDAYRQAGSAVACHAQGKTPRTLSLPAPPEDEDLRRPRPVDLGGGARHRLEQEIIAHWCGLAAEARACFDGGEPAGGWGRALDPLLERGRRVTRSDEENEAYLEWLRRRAAGLLDLPGTWPAVEAVAEALLNEGRLAGPQVTALISGEQQRARRRSGIAGWFRGLR